MDNYIDKLTNKILRAKEKIEILNNKYEKETDKTKKNEIKEKIEDLNIKIDVLEVKYWRELDASKTTQIAYEDLRKLL